jgi:cyclohexyl-isocyanide hydratase
MPLNVVIPLYAGFDSLDVLGPNQAFFFAGMSVTLCAQSTAPVTSFEGVAITPTCSFADCGQADILFVPGGDSPMEVFNLGPAASNPYLQFLVHQAAGAKLVCSVCTGAILLAGAGLLTSRVVTTHWVYKNVLALFDCTVVDDFRRYVQSGNVVTGAGISSGLDEALYLIGLLLGVRSAREVQLKMQYHPQPIFHCGDPADADIKDDPQMVQEVLTEWQSEQTKDKVAKWIASGTAAGA